MELEEIAMTLTLELPAETEKWLRENAMAKGLTIKSYLEELVRTAVEPTGKNGSNVTQETSFQSADQWIAEHRALAKTHEHLIHIVDDSRESIYAGRGE